MSITGNFAKKNHNFQKTENMKREFFSLDIHQSNKMTRYLQLFFGIICIILAVIWLILVIKVLNSTLSYWIVILFLTGFGYYQINSGLGRAARFIDVNDNIIRLKTNSVMPVRTLKAEDILKIIVHPLSVTFLMKDGGKQNLRFGTTVTDMIGPAKQSIIRFGSRNKINTEIETDDF